MKLFKALVLVSVLALGTSCAHHRGGCCETKCSKEKCGDGKDCKDGQCPAKSGEQKTPAQG